MQDRECCLFLWSLGRQFPQETNGRFFHWDLLDCSWKLPLACSLEGSQPSRQCLKGSLTQVAWVPGTWWILVRQVTSQAFIWSRYQAFTTKGSGPTRAPGHKQRAKLRSERLGRLWRRLGFHTRPKAAAWETNVKKNRPCSHFAAPLSTVLGPVMKDLKLSRLPSSSFHPQNTTPK